MVAWQELLDQATRSGPAQGELNCIRAAFRPHRTYIMENKRHFAKKAAELHKQRTGRRLKVADVPILSGVFHEEIENELQKLSVCDAEAATIPCGKASAASSARSEERRVGKECPV